MNKKLILGWFLLVVLASCSEEKKTLKIKSVFDIPENVSENSLINFGFKKEIPKAEEFVDLFNEKGNEAYEYKLKNYSTYNYKKGTLTSKMNFVQGTLHSIYISMDTTVWNKLDKKLSQKTDTVYDQKRHTLHCTTSNYAEINGYNYKCQLPLKREDAWKKGYYYNPNTKKKMPNYSESEFYTVSLERQFTTKHQNKLNRIMKGMKTHFYYSY